MRCVRAACGVWHLAIIGQLIRSARRVCGTAAARRVCGAAAVHASCVRCMRAACGAALLRAPLALIVSIDLSASSREQGEIRVGPEGVARGGSVQNPMQKATISARSGRRSGGCYAFEKRAKPDAESDHFGAVWRQVRRLSRQGEAQVPRLSRLLEACKTRCKKRRFWRGLDAGPKAVPTP